jgi:type I restriction enzyme S subunit
MAASTDMAPYLSLSDQRRLRIEVPPIDVQRRAGRILGAIDDKIEVNRRLSETLQTTARAVFKSWFVAEAATEANGWRTCTIGDLAEVVGGSTPSTAEARFWNGSHYWATPKDLAGLKTPVLLRTERMLTDAGIAQISSGLLPAGTVLMSSRAPIGYLAITEVPVAINQGFIAMKPRPGVSELFLLHWAASSQDEVLSRANGSTFLEISKSSFRPIEVHAPPADAMASFDRVVRPIHERVAANERQVGVLAEIRDALLPRLLSGELNL